MASLPRVESSKCPLSKLISYLVRRREVIPFFFFRFPFFSWCMPMLPAHRLPIPMPLAECFVSFSLKPSQTCQPLAQNPWPDLSQVDGTLEPSMRFSLHCIFFCQYLSLLHFSFPPLSFVSCRQLLSNSTSLNTLLCNQSFLEPVILNTCNNLNHQPSNQPACFNFFCSSRSLALRI